MSLTERVEKALDTVRPYLKADGGDVKVVEITEDGIVKVEMIGACGSCSISPITLKTGIEQAILNEVEEIKSVEAINLTGREQKNVAV
ncbi:NifU family protein [Bernardetia sp.]|uniref:NifU family protein n=1 Tax=Bernardetia sp. TaxID=1937974 RepID=UPI0025C227A6|nr:NifU family protein [Bernardetia sp.]